jgi:regulatory protein
MLTEQRITAIEPQERKKNRRSVFLDGKFTLGVDESVIADLGLHVGQQISEKELQQIVHTELVSKATDRALTLLEYRKRSKAEIVQRLKRVGFDEDIIEETAVRLEKMGLIDDADFSQSWVNHRLAGNAMGKNRIRWELRQKGISSELAEEALAGVDADDEFQSALDTAMRRWKKDNNTDYQAKRRRMVAFLGRQGFNWEIIDKVLNELAVASEREQKQGDIQANDEV